jgi:Ca2+:H+ antiporter
VKKALLLLFAFTPLALIARHFQLSPSVVFVLSALAIIPLAKYVGDATEELSVHTSPAISGLLNATLGNSTELIVGIFALRAGLYEVVKASITGSILGNLLLVLGTAIFVGGYNREQQKFNPTAAKAAGSMLLLATIALVIPAVFAASAPAVSGAVLFHLSVFVSLLMIMAYFAYLIFTLRTHKHLYTGILDSDVEMLAPNWSIRKSLIVLFLAVIAISFMSDELVNSISPLLTQLGWSQLFIGGIVIASTHRQYRRHLKTVWS